MMHSFENSRAGSASLAPPFFLVIVDYNTQRFTLEGPIFDLEPWDKEVIGIRRAGRDVWSFPTEIDAVKETIDMFRSAGLDEWPARSIVDMPQYLPLSVGSIRASSTIVSLPDSKTANVPGAFAFDGKMEGTQPVLSRKSVVRRRSSTRVRGSTCLGR